MPKLRKEHILRHFGDVDDLTLARIQAVGGTEDDLVEAVTWLHDDEILAPLAAQPRNRAAERLYQTLVEVVRDDDWEDEEADRE